MSSSVPADGERILFLDYLRAVACLLVVFGHIFLMGFNGWQEMAPWVPGLRALLFGPDAPWRNVFTQPSLFLALKLGINVGTLGISLFFLISGFVILRAVEREGTKVFLVRRVFRIYPVSMASVLIAVLATRLFCVWAEAASPHTWGALVSSGLVLDGFLHTFPATPVMWSLEVELFFYVFMAMLARRGVPGFRTLLALAVGCSMFTVVVQAPSLAHWVGADLLQHLRHVSFVTLEVPYLLVGSMLYRMTTTRQWKRGALYAALTAGVFLATRQGYIALHGDSGGVDASNGAWALLFFVFALWSGMGWRWIRPLKWVADVSYPLYLVHVPLAWLVLTVLARAGWGMAAAGVASLVAALCVAAIVHLVVETPGRKLGARITRHRKAILPSPTTALS